MKIITHPTIQIIAHSIFLSHPEYRIPTDLDDLDAIPVFAARGCYDSFLPNGRPTGKDTLKNVLTVGHGSVLEHSSISLFIEGISRGCSHEIVRHRHFSFSQRSTRYTSEEDAAIVLEPYYAEIYERAIVKNSFMSNMEKDLLTEFLDSCSASLLAYRNQVNELVKLNPNNLTGTPLRKWARGKARQLLPHALETRMTVTGNLRCWRDFIALRAQPDAEEEIRQLAVMVYDELKDVAPIAFSDFLDLRPTYNSITPTMRKV
jgi:thymidylate synthase, flavin-dependent